MVDMHSYSIFNIKRLFGWRFDDPNVQSDIEQLPFKVVNKAGKPYVSVEY